MHFFVQWQYVKQAIIIAIGFLVINVNAAALEISGSWIQGAMVVGQTSPESQIIFLGRKIKVNPDGFFVIGLGRNAKPHTELIEISPSGRRKVYQFAVEQRTYKEQRIDGVPKRTVNVPESALSRIRREVAITKAARKQESGRQDFLQAFQWPVKGVITGVYGSRRVYNGEPRRPHYGVDIAAPQGTAVTAPVAGRVTLVHNDMYFSGGTLILDHGHGISSTFIHLYKILVKEGDIVEQGQTIAEVGSTGRSTGPHLDWRINWFEQRLDPQLLMDSLPENL